MMQQKKQSRRNDVSKSDIENRTEDKVILNNEATRSFKLGLKIIPLLHRLQAIKVVYFLNLRE